MNIILEHRTIQVLLMQMVFYSLQHLRLRFHSITVRRFPVTGHWVIEKVTFLFSWCQRLAQRTCSERRGDDMVYIVESCQEGRGSKQVRGKRKKNRGPRREARGVDQAYDEGTTFNPHLNAAILEVVENQIRGGNPPETRQTLERLLAAGHSRKQAVEMIGSSLVEDVIFHRYLVLAQA